MFQNYLKIALRNLRKHTAYSLINITGLGIGMAACVLILLYVNDELRYDRFQEHADHIYRAGVHGVISGSEFRSATTSAPMAATLMEEMPEVVSATRLWDTGRVLISRDDQRFYEDNFLWADSTVFDVFTLPLVQGDPQTALTQPNSLVLSQTTARKYFGEADPMGQVLRYDGNADYRVTGVMQDIPRQSHFRADFLASIVTRERSQSPRWISNSFLTYMRLHPTATGADVEAKLPNLIEKYVVPQIEAAVGQNYEDMVAAGLKYEFFVQPLVDLYLRAEGVENSLGATSDIRYVYILGAIALVILLIACINFMNLSTARSANRAKEVGLRKVLGSARVQLIRQFLGESVLLSVLGLVVAIVLIHAVLPAFNGLADKSLVLGLAEQGWVYAALVGIALVAGLLAGLYPAFVLSSFKPVAVLKGQFSSGAKSSWMRSGLVVVQFGISMVLLIGTGVVYNQLDYMQNKRLGFTDEQVVVVPLETSDARDSFESIRSSLLQNPNIISVSNAGVIPGRFYSDTAFRPEGRDDVHVFYQGDISHDYLETFEMELAAGRAFSRDFTTDADGAFLINETAARDLGWTPEEAIGKRLDMVAAADDGGDITKTIVGVIKDFHVESLHAPIMGAVLDLDNDDYYLAARLRSERIAESLALIEAQVQTYQPAHPHRYFFLDEDFGRQYQQEERLSSIFSGFTGLAIFIACLGLFGLASFITQQRTKEIGVRKVLGASVVSIVVLLSKEFTKLVLIASLVAFPIAYFLMDRWLQDFAYSAGISPLTFVLAAVLALAIAWLTVSYQSLKAAISDPVKSLRYE